MTSVAGWLSIYILDCNRCRAAQLLFDYRTVQPLLCHKDLFSYLSLDEVVASRPVFVIVSGSGRRAETLLGPAQ